MSKQKKTKPNSNHSTAKHRKQQRPSNTKHKKTTPKQNKKIRSEPKKLPLKTQPNKTWLLLLLYLLIGGSGLWLVWQNTQELSVWLPCTADERPNFFVLNSLDETGYPFNKPLIDSPNFDSTKMPPNKSLDSYDKEAGYYSQYRAYLTENYLRWPIFAWGKKHDIHWQAWSSFFYLVLMFLILAVLAFIQKERRIPLLVVAFLMLLTGISPWASASFHYVRYYPFLFMAFLLSQVVCTYIYTYARWHIYIKMFVILVLAFLPYVFHLLGAYYFFFWLAFFVFRELRSIIKDFNRKNLIKTATVLLIVTVALALNWHAIRAGLLQINSWESSLQNANKFWQLNFDTSPVGIFVLVIVLALGAWSVKYLTRHEKHLLTFSGSAFVLSFLFLMPMLDANYTDLNGVNRYAFFLHALYLMALATLLVAIIRHFSARLQKRWALPAGSIAIALLLFSGIFSLSKLELEDYNFSLLLRISSEETEAIRQAVQDKEVVVLTTDVGAHWIALPEQKTYSIDKSFTNERLCEVLAENKGKYILFTFINPEFLQQLYNAKVVTQSFNLSKYEQQPQWPAPLVHADSLYKMACANMPPPDSTKNEE